MRAELVHLAGLAVGCGVGFGAREPVRLVGVFAVALLTRSREHRIPSLPHEPVKLRSVEPDVCHGGRPALESRGRHRHQRGGIVDALQGLRVVGEGHGISLRVGDVHEAHRHHAGAGRVAVEAVVIAAAEDAVYLDAREDESRGF